jgi:hypothetical protein
MILGKMLNAWIAKLRILKLEIALIVQMNELI